MRGLPRQWWYLAAMVAALTTGCMDGAAGTAEQTVPAPRISELAADAAATAASAPSSTAPSTSASGTAPFSSIDARLSTFERLATATGLDAGGGPVTVLAPTNEAFATTLGASDLKDDDRRRLLQDHVVPGTVTRADLRPGERLRTLSGDMLTINVTRGNAFVIDSTGIPATLVETDLVAGNVTVHVIDRVLVPDAEGRNRISP